MQKLEKAILAVMVLSLAGSVILIALSPETVPAHYNLAGEVDRFGSRYEALIWPLCTAGTGAFFLLFARSYRKQKGAAYAADAKILLCTGVLMTLFFTVLGFYFTWKGVTYAPGSAVTMDTDALIKVVSVATGVLLVALSNFMPKAQRNEVFGLRTKWSLASDAVWQRSQRFAGISGVICGLVLILLALFVPGVGNLAAMIVVTLLWGLLGVAASYRYWKEEQG